MRVLSATEKEVDACLSAVSARHFLTHHCYLRDENNNRKIQWQPWDYLLDLVDILQIYQEIDVDKARQLGVSWVLIFYGLWKGLFNEVSRNLYLSQGEKEAWELIGKTRYAWRHLPEHLKVPLDTDTRSTIAFKGNDSDISSLPSTKKAGSGYNATLVVRDELYNHPEAEENFGYIAPSIDSGGQMINMSCVYGDDMSNHFVKRVEDIANDVDTVKKVYPSGLELYTNPKYPTRALVFLGWRLRPVRLEGITLEEFYNTRLKPRYTPQQLSRMYPENLEDTLKITVGSSFFEYQALDDMGYDVCPPIKQSEYDTFNNVIRYYKLPIVGRKYVVFTDPSDGVGDPFVTGVLDYVTGEVVASATAKEKVDRVAQIHDFLVRTYDGGSSLKGAVNSYEYNGSVGGSMSECLRNMNTPNQAPRRKSDGTIDPDHLKRGQTVSGQHKDAILGDLASLGIAKRQIICHDREFMQQAKLVSRIKDNNGAEHPGTDRNHEFDWVMMMAGLWQLQKYAPRGGFRAVTVDL